MPGIDLRSGERGEACHVEEVLDGEGHARQRTGIPARGKRGVHGLGIAHGSVGEDDGEAVEPRIGVDLVPLLGGGDALQVFSLAYEPSFAFYQSEPDESNNAHRVITQIKGSRGSLSFALDGSLSFIDGDRVAPTYPGGLENAAATTAPRERRKQINSQATAHVQYDAGAWFVRPTASLLFWDMMTKLLDVEGYQTYVDRYEADGGVDVGYRVSSQFAITLGYRYGHQYQEKLPFKPLQSSNDYQRILVGAEGKP